MTTRCLAALVLAAVLAGAGCRRSNEQVKPEGSEEPGGLARPAPAPPPSASAAPPPTVEQEEASGVLTARPGPGATRWFDPPQSERMNVFSVSGAVIAAIGQGLYRVDGDRLSKVPVRYARNEHPELMFEIMQVSGRYPGQLWIGRASVVARTPFVEFYRQQPGGDFVEVPIGWMAFSRPSLAWDGERLLRSGSDGQPMRWVDPAGQETPATLAGLPSGCDRAPHGFAPPTSRGWVLELMACQPGGTQLWLFDHENRGRPIEGVRGNPQALLVRPDGDTWFAVKGPKPSLCHLVGGKARCEPVPTSSGWVHALGERGDDLEVVSGDGVWNYHAGKFTREPLAMPDAPRGRIVGAVRDPQGRIWGVAQEDPPQVAGAQERGARYRLFRREP